MKQGKFHWIWLGLFLILNTAHTQQFVISDELNMRNDFSYYLVPMDEDIALVRDKAVRIIYQKLNQDQTWTNEKELNLEGKRWKLLDVFKHRDQIGILYTCKLDHSYKCVYSVFDQNGTKRFQRIIGDSIDLSIQENTNLQSSENKDFVSIGVRDKNNKAILILYNRMQDSIYYEIGMEQFTNQQDGPAEEALLSNDGDFYLKYESENQERSKQKYITKVFGLNSSGEQIIDQSLHLDFNIYASKLALKNNQKELVIAGLINKQGDDELQGYFIQNLSKGNAAKYFGFDEKQLKEWSGKKNRTSVLPVDLQMKDIKFLLDGSILMFLESVKQYVRRPYFGSGTDNGSAFMNNRWTDYYYDDILVCCVNENGEKNWETNLRKKQFSQDDDGINSSFFIHSNKSILRILFNDEIKNESTVSEYVLLPNGLSNRKSILNTSNNKLSLRIRDAIQIKSNQLIIPNENNGKLSIVKLLLN